MSNDINLTVKQFLSLFRKEIFSKFSYFEINNVKFSIEELAKEKDILESKILQIRDFNEFKNHDDEDEYIFGYRIDKSISLIVDHVFADYIEEVQLNPNEFINKKFNLIRGSEETRYYSMIMGQRIILYEDPYCLNEYKNYNLTNVVAKDKLIFLTKNRKNQKIRNTIKKILKYSEEDIICMEYIGYHCPTAINKKFPDLALTHSQIMRIKDDAEIYCQFMGNAISLENKIEELTKDGDNSKWNDYLNNAMENFVKNHTIQKKSKK